MADGARFELARGFRPLHTFQACAFNRSAIHPQKCFQKVYIRIKEKRQYLFITFFIFIAEKIYGFLKNALVKYGGGGDSMKKVTRNVCRAVGWLLIFTALLTVSAEGVVALGTGERVEIVASDVFTIITGNSPASGDTFAGKMMLWPAWTFIGAAGMFLVFATRPKRSKIPFAR